MNQGPRRVDSPNYFTQSDPSVHMLGLPQSRPRLGKWGVLAIIAGAILAVAVIVIENALF